MSGRVELKIPKGYAIDTNNKDKSTVVVKIIDCDATEYKTTASPEDLKRWSKVSRPSKKNIKKGISKFLKSIGGK